jgi:hypothetical protein
MRNGVHENYLVICFWFLFVMVDLLSLFFQFIFGFPEKRDRGQKPIDKPQPQ